MSIDELYEKMTSKFDQIIDNQKTMQDEIKTMQGEMKSMQGKIQFIKKEIKDIKARINKLESNQQFMQNQINDIVEHFDKKIHKIEDKLDYTSNINLPHILNELTKAVNKLNQSIIENQVEHKGLDYRISKLEIS